MRPDDLQYMLDAKFGSLITAVNGIAAGETPFGITGYDYQSFTYIGSTNNIGTQVFKTGGSGGTIIATLTYTYVGAGASNNDKVASITKS